MDSQTANIPIWLAIIGFSAPLIALAGSAVAFVVNIYKDAAATKRRDFFELMQFIDSDKPIATKTAAVYQLRTYLEHRDFIVRFCDEQAKLVEGPTAHVLAEEMRRTADALRPKP